jgi:hypothetical protein
VHAKFAGDEVAGDNAACCTIDDDQVEHLRARDHGDLAQIHLPFESLIGAEQQLLAGLAARVEGARNLRAAEGAVFERPSVFARERNTLSDALVDDVDAVLREAVDVPFASAEVAALHRVVEEAKDAVAVILVILGGVNAALRGDGVGTAGRILEAEAFDIVAEFAERGGGRRAGESGANDDEGMAALIGRVDQLHLELRAFPGIFNRTGRNSCVEFHRGHLTHPASTLTGIEM